MSDATSDPARAAQGPAADASDADAKPVGAILVVAVLTAVIVVSWFGMYAVSLWRG